MGSFITLGTIQTALELGVIYSLVALALFLSFSMLNVCDLSTDVEHGVAEEQRQYRK